MKIDYKIFLSSTFDDLQKHRKAVLDILNKMNLKIFAMEHIGALPGNPADECVAGVKSSDIYIGIFGTRYGFEDEHGISITEIEYETAWNEKKKILNYILDDSGHPVLPKYVDKDKKADKLRLFKNKLKKRHYCGFFTSPENLSVLVATDLVNSYTSDFISKAISEGMALQKEIPKLFTEGLYLENLVPSKIDLSLSLKQDSESLLSFSDKRFSEALTGLFIAQNLSLGNVDVMKGFVTLAYETWDSLLFFCNKYGVDESSIQKAISQTHDVDHLRLLISLAGHLKLYSCADAICRSARFISMGHHKELQNHYLYTASPFFVTVKDALFKMNEKILPTLEKHLKDSKVKKQWQAYKAIKTVKKRILSAQDELNRVNSAD